MEHVSRILLGFSGTVGELFLMTISITLGHVAQIAITWSLGKRKEGKAEAKHQERKRVHAGPGLTQH
eukprot:2901230-Amphidinium_carterae.1